MSDLALTILAALTTRFRRVTADLMAEYIGIAERRAVRELNRLHAAGWVRAVRVLAPRVELTEPLAVHHAGGPPPDYRAVARTLAARTPAMHATWAYSATPRAVPLVGGTSPDLSKPDQAGHDLEFPRVS